MTHRQWWVTRTAFNLANHGAVNGQNIGDFLLCCEMHYSKKFALKFSIRVHLLEIPSFSEKVSKHQIENFQKCVNRKILKLRKLDFKEGGEWQSFYRKSWITFSMWSFTFYVGDDSHWWRHNDIITTLSCNVKEFNDIPI